MVMRRSVHLFLIVLLLLLAACGGKRRPEPLYYSAENALRRGELRDAAGAYRLFIDDPGPNGARYVPRAYYMLATAEYRLGEYKDALATLDELEQKYPKSNWLQVWALRGDISLGLNERVNALQEWDEAWRIADPVDRQRLQKRISQALDDMTVQELTKADNLVTDPTVHDMIQTRLVAAGGGIIPEPPPQQVQAVPRRPEIDDFIEPLPPPDEGAVGRPRAPAAAPAAHAAEAPRPQLRADLPPENTLDEAALADIPERDRAAAAARPSTSKVAVLVPLTGPQAATGQGILTAIHLAFGNQSSRIVERDVGSSAAGVTEAWNSVRQDPDVLAAIAWVGGDSGNDVAALAETSGIPLILLSPYDGAAGAYVRPWGTGREAEISRLLDYSVHKVGLRRFAVLYPETVEGRSYLGLFSREAAQLGAAVVASRGYAAGQLNGQQELAAVAGWRGRPTNIEALFIADDSAAAQALASTINSRFSDLILLGTEGWARLGNTAQAHAIRAFLAAPMGTPSGQADAFPAQFQTATGRTPSAIDAEAYSAGDLLQEALADNEATRVQVRARVKTARAATGGEPVILRLYDGRLENVSTSKAAPTTPAESPS